MAAKNEQPHSWVGTTRKKHDQRREKNGSSQTADLARHHQYKPCWSMCNIMVANSEAHPPYKVGWQWVGINRYQPSAMGASSLADKRYSCT